MGDSSFEEESADEYDGYDPVHSRLVDDKVTYRPRYAPSEHNEDSSSDDLNDEPEDRASYSHYFPHSPVGSPDERPVVKSEQNESQKSTDNDREYHVEPVVDVTTPCYAPSQALSRTPESSPALSYTASEHASDVVPTKKVESNIPERIAELEESEDNNSSSSESDIDEYSPDVQQHESDKSRDDLVENVPQTKSGSPAEPEHYKEFHGIFEDNDEEQDQGKFNEDFEGFERDEQPESQVDGIIADIFGESDAEEEFEGFAENELDKGIEEEVEIQTSEQVSHKSHKPTSAENDDDEESGEDDEFVSDFDRIMAKKKEELRRRRKRNRDIEFLNDSDDLIVEMISRMKNAADEDRQLLSAGQPATKKLSMFKDVSALLRRADLKSALIENGMLSAITEWLSPLPGHTLPNLIIRDSMLTSLSEFQSLSPEVLQESGIGKALMYLYKHPRETRENKDKAGRLINEWLRPIFNLKSDYRTLTKEERKQLDYEHLPKRRNIDNEDYNHRDINRELDGEGKGVLRPGDPGWINRARVPQPSNKDYIVRPKWRVRENPNGDDDDDEGNDDRTDESQSLNRRRRKPGSSGFGATSRIEGHIRNLTNSARRSHAKAARAVPMSIEGRNMSL